MKKVILSVFVFIVSSILPAGPSVAQQSPSQVPATYPGDSHQTITRRAQWVEEAKKEGKLVWWGVLQPQEAKEVITAFNALYPFIKVDYWRGRGEEIATKLEAEYAGGLPTADVSYGGAPENFPRWAKRGMIQEFTSVLPGLEKIDKRMYGKRGDWIMPGLNPKIPQYNTRLVSAAEAPKNWEDLLDPKWKGQMGAEIESINWATLAIAEGGWGIEKTDRFLARLKEQKLRFVQGGRATHALLIAGEFKVMAMGNLRHVLISQAKQAPVEWVRANPIQVDAPSFILLKQSPHPNAAKLFLEWVFSPKGLVTWADVSQSYIPSLTSPVSRLLEGIPLVVQTEEVVLKIIEMGLLKKYNKELFGIED